VGGEVGIEKLKSFEGGNGGAEWGGEGGIGKLKSFEGGNGGAEWGRWGSKS
jgi:hypothetical protein